MPCASSGVANQRENNGSAADLEQVKADNNQWLDKAQARLKSDRDMSQYAAKKTYERTKDRS
jgi:hypothetical protein